MGNLMLGCCIILGRGRHTGWTAVRRHPLEEERGLGTREKLVYILFVGLVSGDDGFFFFSRHGNGSTCIVSEHLAMQ